MIPFFYLVKLDGDTCLKGLDAVGLEEGFKKFGCKHLVVLLALTFDKFVFF